MKWEIGASSIVIFRMYLMIFFPKEGFRDGDSLL